jgi:hypothetical protein
MLNHIPEYNKYVVLFLFRRPSNNYSIMQLPTLEFNPHLFKANNPGFQSSIDKCLYKMNRQYSNKRTGRQHDLA